MRVSVLALASEGVVLAAPLAPNINHQETVFGGSASTLAILAAWCLVHTRLVADGLKARVVIQRNSMSYDLPMDGDFRARSFLEPAQDWAGFTRMLARKGRARITASAVLEFGGQVTGRFSGEFVALG
jgi:thioesterase domain-containing protein